MGALKDLYSPAFYKNLADAVCVVIPAFDKKEFHARIFDAGFKKMELKERMRHTTQVLHEFLSADFGKAVRQIEKIITVLRKNKFDADSLPMIFFPDYIETYGLDHYDDSVRAMEFITRFVSCEFAVRPFILKYGNRMMVQMQAWSLHKSDKVRRLATEGSRPRLPWAMAIPALKKDPALLLPILENLKNDPSESVRRSVANNLNDIAKDHPHIVLKIAAEWKGFSRETDAIIKHGSRTLLKKGHPEILSHFGLDSTNIILNNFKVHTPAVRVGKNLEFSFSLINKNSTPQKVRLEYAVQYQMKNGHSAKVFKISERIYQPGEKAIIQRKQKFVLITTRKFYPGVHQLSIIINGQQKAMKEFELLV